MSSTYNVMIAIMAVQSESLYVHTYGMHIQNWFCQCGLGFRYNCTSRRPKCTSRRPKCSSGRSVSNFSDTVHTKPTPIRRSLPSSDSCKKPSVFRRSLPVCSEVNVSKAFQISMKTHIVMLIEVQGLPLCIVHKYEHYSLLVQVATPTRAHWAHGITQTNMEP